MVEILTLKAVLMAKATLGSVVTLAMFLIKNKSLPSIKIYVAPGVLSGMRVQMTRMQIFTR